MHGVGAPPLIVGRDRQDAEHAAGPVVGFALREERSVPAVVLDHEQANKKAGGGQKEQPVEPPGLPAHGKSHDGPEPAKRHQRDRELKKRASPICVAKPLQRAKPARRVRSRGRSDCFAHRVA